MTQFYDLEWLKLNIKHWKTLDLGLLNGGSIVNVI
jgi:hypothetical protein